jgi:hypothetical protein
MGEVGDNTSPEHLQQASSISIVENKHSEGYESGCSGIQR